MHFTLVAVASMLLLASCGDSKSDPQVEQTFSTAEPDSASARTVLVRVVDAEGRAVAGAHVGTDYIRPDDWSISEYVFAGSLGQAELDNAIWLTNETGEVRVNARRDDICLVARDGDRWGAADATNRQASVEIVVARDESVRVLCVDPEGRPAVGALVCVSAGALDDSENGESVTWGSIVTASDGTIDLPHAQYWRGLQRKGRDVQIAGYVMWGIEPHEDPWIPFPAQGEDPIRFELLPSGFIDVRADESLAGLLGDLRWMDAPAEYLGEDADPEVDIPEFPIALPKGVPFAVPLGRRFEIYVGVPDRVDPRIAFDGPRTPGERVEVVIPRTPESALVHGRLLNEKREPLEFHYFEAWLDRGGVRVEPDDPWLVAQDDGQFWFELPPGTGGTLNIAATGSKAVPGGVHLTIDGVFARTREPTRVPIERLVTGANDVGDVVCASRD